MKKNAMLTYEPWVDDSEGQLQINHDNPMNLSQSVTFIRATPETLVMEFYQDGDLIASFEQTYEQWFSLIASLEEGKK